VPPFVIHVQLKTPIASMFGLRLCKECSIHLRIALVDQLPRKQRSLAVVMLGQASYAWQTVC